MIGLIAGIAGGLISTVGGLAKSASGARMMREAQEAIKNYKRQDLQNAFDEVGVSRLGADLLKQENLRLAATSVDALRTSGARGLGMIGAIQRNTNMMNQQLAADLDRQQQGLNMARAQDNANIRGMQEQREREDLAGLGRQLEVGRQDKFGGIQDVGQGLLSLGAIGMNSQVGQTPGGPGGVNGFVSQVQTNPMGLAPMSGYSLPAQTNPMGLTSMDKLTAPIYNG